MGGLVKFSSVPYDMLKVKVDSRLTGTFYDSIIDAMHSTYKPIIGRVSHKQTTKLNGNINVEMNNPITYEVVFDGDNKVNTPLFFFGVPSYHTGYMKQRIQAILPNSTITIEKNYDEMFENSFTFEYSYVKDSMLSLKVKDNNFLQSILNIKNDIQKGEKILLQVEMTPLSDSWKSFVDEKWDKVRSGNDVTTKRTLFDKSLDMGNGMLNSALSIMDEIVEYKIPSADKSLDKKDKAINVSQFSSSSKTKKNNDGFGVRIRAYIVTKDKMMARTYAVAIETCMRELEEDNRLKAGKCKIGNVKRGELDLGFNRNIMSSKEVASIVNLPNQKLQREFKIDSVSMKQIDIPKECKNTDWIRIGTYEYHGEQRTAHFPSTKRNMCLSKILLTLMGGGKTNAILNFMVDGIKVGNGVFLIDHINECELTKALVDIYGSKVKTRNLANNEELFGFCFPEIYIEDTDDADTRLDKANDIAYEVEYLINSIACNTDPVTELMSSYLFSACKVVFIHNYKTVNDVINVLMNKKVRDELIDKAIQENVLTEDSFEVMKLRQLDDSDKEIKGVLNRISVLTKDSLFQRMLKKPCDYNDSLVNIFDNQIPFSVMMPQDVFSNKKKKDVITTFLLSRVRLAMLRRKDKDKMCDVFIDEPQQLRNTMDVIAESIYEPRKFGLSYVFCLHSLSQLENLKEAVTSAGGHYMLLGGCTESAFNELKSKISADFTYEDVTDMEKWHSLNVITIDGKTHTFITKLPEPQKDKNGRMYINS